MRLWMFIFFRGYGLRSMSKMEPPCKVASHTRRRTLWFWRLLARRDEGVYGLCVCASFFFFYSLMFLFDIAFSQYHIGLNNHYFCCFRIIPIQMVKWYPSLIVWVGFVINELNFIHVFSIINFILSLKLRLQSVLCFDSVPLLSFFIVEFVQFVLD
jgi:hypothetical protein